MNINNLIEYMKLGLTIKPDSKRFRRLVGASGIWTIIGFLYGIILGGYWKYIAIIMVITFLCAVVGVFVLSRQCLTIKNRLILQSIIYLSWNWQLILLETIIFTMAYGFGVHVLLLHLPSVLIPLLLGMKTAKMLKRDTPFSSKPITLSKIRLTGGMAGIIGMNFVAVFKNMSQSTAIVIAVVCCVILNSIFSFGFLYLQRLYYLFKYEKLGMLPKEFFSNNNSPS